LGAGGFRYYFQDHRRVQEQFLADFLDAAKSSMKRVTGRVFPNFDFTEARRNFKWDFFTISQKS
jgi:hypothetical protein